MDNADALVLFQRCGALLKGHFLLSSGLHSGDYLEKFRLVENPRLLTPMSEELAARYREDQVQIVVGPTTAGIILAYDVARCLRVQARYAEKVDGERQFRRGQVLEPGTRVLIVDDILTTGGAVRECLQLVQSLGAEAVGVGVLGDRSGGSVNLGVRLEALLTVHPATYSPDSCPLCAEGVPLVKPGTSAR